jgi:hypothetical protein
MEHCQAVSNGFNPGTGSEWVTIANPKGQRPLGTGLFIHGGDSSAGTTIGFYAGSNAGFGFWDDSFLGNCHVMPTSENNFHIVKDIELSIYNHPSASIVEKNWFNPYSHSTGSRLDLGFRQTNKNSRSLYANPYVEGAGIIDVVAPGLIINGIGGADSKDTVRIKPGILSGIWKGTNSNANGGVNFFEIANSYDTTSIFAFGNSLDYFGSGRYKMTFDPSGTVGFKGFYALNYLGVAIPFMLTSGQSNAYDGRKLGLGKMVLNNHYVNGVGALPVEYGSRVKLPPTSSDYPIGSTYNIVDPIPGGYCGYKMVQSGSIKTWKGFGLIDK